MTLLHGLYQNYVDRTVSQKCIVYKFGKKIIAKLYYLTLLIFFWFLNYKKSFVPCFFHKYFHLLVFFVENCLRYYFKSNRIKKNFLKLLGCSWETVLFADQQIVQIRSKNKDTW